MEGIGLRVQALLLAPVSRDMQCRRWFCPVPSCFSDARIEMHGRMLDSGRMALLPLISSRVLMIAALAIGLCGCASEPIEGFKDGRPALKPERYFAGRAHSWGILETPSGKPKEVLHTRTTGKWDGRCLHFEQDILFERENSQHRSWLVRRLDGHHYSATGTGIIGTAYGEAWGNAFHLEFTLDALPGNPLGRVRMSQWMYLQADGATLVNRDTLTKNGFIVAEITEQFRKE
jgi:hypothetical protein